MTGQGSTRMHPWAIGITVVVIVFPLVFIGLAVWIGSQDVELVRENYYEGDRSYQDEIDTRKRTSALSERPIFTFAPDQSECTVSFPPAAEYSKITGNLKFYRVDDDHRDFDVSLALDSAGRQVVSLAQMNTGQWIIKLRWQSEEIAYYLEERMYKQ